MLLLGVFLPEVVMDFEWRDPLLNFYFGELGSVLELLCFSFSVNETWS